MIRRTLPLTVSCLLALASAVSAQEVPRTLKNLLVVNAGLHVIDLSTTTYALDAGAVERNPALGRLETRQASVALSTALTAGQTYLILHVARKHPKQAYVLLGLSLAVEAFAIGNNVSLARTLR